MDFVRLMLAGQGLSEPVYLADKLKKGGRKHNSNHVSLSDTQLSQKPTRSKMVKAE